MKKVTRVALYIRVSTEEQALSGFSLTAQKDDLVAYAEEKQMRIVGIYADEGISARKSPFKRPALQRLLQDVEDGKLDMILFIKIDRWFRNVREYHKVQEILDRNRVVWKCTQEEYDTATADGRLKVNIMLSVAENEADRTAERIRFVNESKIRNREVVTGAQPLGYMVATDEEGKKRAVKDPLTQDAVQDFWDQLIATHSVSAAGSYVNRKYGLTRQYHSWARTANREEYTGMYRGVPDYYPPYVSPEDFALLKAHKNVKATKKNRIYLFSGLITCPDCNINYTSTYQKHDYGEYYRYRCFKSRCGICDNNTSISERVVEEYLLENIEQELQNYILKVEAEGKLPKPKHKYDLANLKEQLRRLNVSYRMGAMDDDEYMKEAAGFNKLIEEAQKEEQKYEMPDITPIKKFLENGFDRDLYETLTREEKRRLWRSVIDEIIVDKNKVKNISPRLD